MFKPEPLLLYGLDLYDFTLFATRKQDNQLSVELLDWYDRFFPATLHQLSKTSFYPNETLDGKQTRKGHKCPAK